MTAIAYALTIDVPAIAAMVLLLILALNGGTP